MGICVLACTDTVEGSWGATVRDDRGKDSFRTGAVPEPEAAPGSPTPQGLPQTAGRTSTTCPRWCPTKHLEGEIEPTLHYGPH
jgi:hypothetical protein